jgi:hypothetical protein
MIDPTWLSATLFIARPINACDYGDDGEARVLDMARACIESEMRIRLS